jgi:hypothetical protein
MLHYLTMDTIVQQILHHAFPPRSRETVLSRQSTLSLGVFLSQVVRVERGQLSEQLLVNVAALSICIPDEH